MNMPIYKSKIEKKLYRVFTGVLDSARETEKLLRKKPKYDSSGNSNERQIPLVEGLEDIFED